MPDAAQIMVTTQQRIERRSEGRAFADVKCFHYRGAPRSIRVWDEAFAPGVAIALNEDDVAFLLKPARKLSAKFRASLGAFFLQLSEVRSGSLIDVPDWEARYGVSVHDLLATIGGRDVKDIRDDQRSAAQALFILAGKAASVWRDNYSGPAVLTYKDTLPADLAPLLVLDASGRVIPRLDDHDS